MMYQAKVLMREGDSEGDVVVEINGLILTCFATVCPYKIDAGKTYPVELSPFFYDEAQVIELPNAQHELRYTGDAYKYSLVGKVLDGALVVGGFVFDGAEIFENPADLEGRTYRVNVDRMDIIFC